MEEIKRDIKEVQKELHEELQLITKLHEDQKQVTRVQKEEIDRIETCVNENIIEVAKHDVRLATIEGRMSKQNGLLDKMDGKIDDVAHGIDVVVKKVDAMGVNLANRMNGIERNGIKREAEHEKCADDKITAAKEVADDKIAAAKEKADRDVADLRAEWLRSRIAFNWKIIGALASLAFLFILVFVSYSFHVFGGLP